MSVYIDNFEMIFGVKNNIQTLRNKVLELAIHGKLIEQDPNDEPASELVKRIKVERGLLVKEGKIKKQQPLNPIKEDEIPFKIPHNWEWIRFGDIATFKKGPFGSSITKSMFIPKGKSTYKIYEQKNAIQKDNTIGDYYISEDKFNELISFEVFPNDIIVSCAGTIGETYIMPHVIERGIINQALMKINLTDLIEKEFFLMFFELVLNSHITSKSKGSAIKNIPPLDILKSIPFSLPSVKEQIRIIDKYKWYMSQINELEGSLNKKENLMELLPKAVVESIENCQTGEELKEQLQFVIDNFETIFQTPGSMQELRNVVLQLAIEGKLVPQDSVEEPASELVKKIQAERDKLVKEGEIRKQQSVAPIEEDEIPFEVPDNWSWVRLDQICEYIQRGKSPKYSTIEKYPVIAQKCVQWSGVSLEKALFIEPETIEKYSEERFLVDGDILWNSTGTGSCGRVGKFTDSIRDGFDKIVADSHITVVRCFKQFINYDYLFIWLKSPEVQSVIESKASGSTNQIELATSTIREYLISLPPLAEQYRIVQKVNSIMGVVDNLEEELKKKRSLLENIAV